MNKNKVLDRVLKECFWDYNISKDELLKIINSNNLREKRKLFEKIIYNSFDKLLPLKLFFTKEELEYFFKNFKITYNQKYIKRHILVLENLLLGKKHKIKGLEWKKV